MTIQSIDPTTATGSLHEEFAASEKAFGFIPNLHKSLGVSEQVLKAYKMLHQHFLNSSFSNIEKTVVWQTINFYHSCHYCLPAHTAIAHMMQVDADIIEALQKGEALKDGQLSVLQATTYALIDQRGQLSEAQETAFKQAGYNDQHLIEIVLGIAQKTLSNYTNHLAQTPVDDKFLPFVK